jgi:hypothetical protein
MLDFAVAALVWATLLVAVHVVVAWPYVPVLLLFLQLGV